jgi:hypothetical protein
LRNLSLALFTFYSIGAFAEGLTFTDQAVSLNLSPSKGRYEVTFRGKAAVYFVESTSKAVVNCLERSVTESKPVKLEVDPENLRIRSCR